MRRIMRQAYATASWRRAVNLSYKRRDDRQFLADEFATRRNLSLLIAGKLDRFLGQEIDLTQYSRVGAGCIDAEFEARKEPQFEIL
jgi:hypothetical protein